MYTYCFGNSRRDAMTSIKKLVQLVGLGLATMGLVACGGGGSTDGGSNLTTQSGTGLMSLAVTDAPIDDAEKVVVRFTHVELQPADGSERVVIGLDSSASEEESLDPDSLEGEPTTLDEESVDTSAQGTVKEIDLLALQGGKSAFLFEKIEVPEGDYDWIRFYLEPEPGPSAPPLSNFLTSSYIEFKNGHTANLIIPGGLQAGLQLVSGFNVPEGGSVSYTVDFDLRNMIQATDEFGGGYYRMRRALRLVDNSNVGVITGIVDHELFPDDYECNIDTPNGTTRICPGLAVYVYAADAAQNGGGSVEAESLDTLAAEGVDEPLPLTTANVRYQLVEDSLDYEYRYTAAFLTAGESYNLELTYKGDDGLEVWAKANDIDDVVAGETTVVDFPYIAE
jgi:hypothetical protein